PDFVKYAQSYGAFGHRIHSNEELYTILDECLNSKGVHLIEVPVDYSENEKVLIEELDNLTCELVY
ncbi:MAG: thiamine pyrophosphate-dependent enzyme, partial [Thermodesulfobacteriota bacterium]